MRLNLYGCEAVWNKLKNRQKCIFCVFRPFWAYVGEPHGHIGWATSMPFASINSTNPRTNPWNFHKNYWEFRGLEYGFFLSWPFWILFVKRDICFISMKTSSPFIWDITYFCTMHGFFRILEKTSSELICTRLYSLIQEETLILDTKINSKSEEKI